ncbi:hypothetical protein HI914_03183 [Erysiphe necator]|nr:hypothetical protein HI914_03183 [Erysiphe necator]
MQTSKPRKIGNGIVTKNKPEMSPCSFGKSANGGLCDELWMRIFELTDARFLSTRARLICRRFKNIIDNCNSLFLNQRIEIYGTNLPGPPKGMSERQYNNLLGGKGCEECSDRSCTATKWAWYKRWCVSCWEKKIAKEHDIVRDYENYVPEIIMLQLLECLPYCMYDAYMKPQDVRRGRSTNPHIGPKVYKYYQTRDVADIIESYKTLLPAPYDEDPTLTLDEQISAMIKYQDLTEKLFEKRRTFLAQKNRERDELMERVYKIENAIRIRRQEISRPNKIARQGRREFHTKMAMQELPHIPIDFIQKGKSFKASCRIYRNAGTERTWKALKPKIENEWKQELEKRATFAVESNTNVDILESYLSKNSSTQLKTNSLPYQNMEKPDLMKKSFIWQESSLSQRNNEPQIMPRPLTNKYHPIRTSCDISLEHRLSFVSNECLNAPEGSKLNIARSTFKNSDVTMVMPQNGQAFQAEPNSFGKKNSHKSCESNVLDDSSYRSNTRPSILARTLYETSQIKDIWNSPHAVSLESSVIPNSTERTVIPISSLLTNELLPVYP